VICLTPRIGIIMSAHTSDPNLEELVSKYNAIHNRLSAGGTHPMSDWIVRTSNEWIDSRAAARVDAGIQMPLDQMQLDGSRSGEDTTNLDVDDHGKKPSVLKRPSSTNDKTDPIGKVVQTMYSYRGAAKSTKIKILGKCIPVVMKKSNLTPDVVKKKSMLAKKKSIGKDSNKSKLNTEAVVTVPLDSKHTLAPYTTSPYTTSALLDAETDDESRDFNLHDGAAAELGPEYRAVWMKAYVKKCTVARCKSKCWEKQQALKSIPGDGQEVCEILKFPCESFPYNVKADPTEWTARCMENHECQSEPANGSRKVWLTLRANYVVPRAGSHVPMTHNH